MININFLRVKLSSLTSLHRNIFIYLAVLGLSWGMSDFFSFFFHLFLLVGGMRQVLGAGALG